MTQSLFSLMYTEHFLCVYLFLRHDIVYKKAARPRRPAPTRPAPAVIAGAALEAEDAEVLAAELAEEAAEEALLRAEPAELLMEEAAAEFPADEAEERRLD